MKKYLLITLFSIFFSCGSLTSFEKEYNELKLNEKTLIKKFPDSHIVSIRGFSYLFFVSNKKGSYKVKLKNGVIKNIDTVKVYGK